MMPGHHAAVSLGVGLLGWWWSKSTATLPLSLAVGTLVDLDHLADYAWYAISDEHRLILPLHAYEWVLPLYWGAERLLGSRAAFAVATSYAIHLMSDELGNSTMPGTYFLMWRIVKGFQIDALSRDPQAGVQGRQEDLDKLEPIVSRMAGRIPRGLSRL